MNTDTETDIYQSLERLSIEKVSRCAHLMMCTLANCCTLYTPNLFLCTLEISLKINIFSILAQQAGSTYGK